MLAAIGFDERWRPGAGGTVSETTHIRVVNWDRHQHYKNGKLKGPAQWIKLHRELLGNYDFQQLPERDRFCVVGFYLLAAEKHNKIPEDIPWIKRKLAIRRHPPIDTLIASGFLERV